MTDQATFPLPEGSSAPAPIFSAPEPHSAADPATIAAWAQDQAHSRLADFMAIHHDKPLDVLAFAIRTACQRGFGNWMVPDDHTHRPHHRPGTHMIEIALFGATGTGLSLIEAASSWRTAATRILQEVSE
jgi:hypothetical protein